VVSLADLEARIERLERLNMIAPPPPRAPAFVEPRRECDARPHGIRCGTHVIKYGHGAWWCPSCCATRSLANTTEVLGAPPKARP